LATPRIVMKLCVAEIRAEPGDVRVITLEHPSRPHLPPFGAGAHVDLHLPNGRVRQYSLMGDEKDRSRYLIGVKREPEGRGGSAWLHDQLALGDILPVSSPRSHFALAPGTSHLLLAGGIGITPLLAMGRRLKETGQHFHLHYFARSRASTPLLSDISQALESRHVSLHFDDEPATQCDLVALLAPRQDDQQLYYCGPAGFMRAISAAAAHWPEEAVHFEAFAAPRDEDFTPEPFTLRLASSGALLPVPAGESALEALRSVGIALPSACENGACGTCECGYLDGEALHRDGVLRPSARANRFIPCVSRAKGTLTLDL